MNVLELVQAACYTAGVRNAPSTLFGNTNPEARQLLNILYDICRQIRQARTWPQLKKVYTFTTENGRQSYNLPQDFWAALYQTGWDTGNGWPLDGPMTDELFNWRLYGYATLENVFGYRIFGPDINPNTGGQFQVNPVPGTGNDTLTFNYLTKSFFAPPLWTPLTAVTGVGTTYRFSNGQTYVLATNGTTGAASTLGPSGTGTGITDGTAVWDAYLPAYDAIKSDSDLCLFDDDLVIKGLVWRFLRQGGQQFDVERQDFESALSAAASRWDGPMRGSFAGQPAYLSGYTPNVPESGFG